MNEKIQKVKTRLLELGYIDNEWLDKYLEILESNLTTARNRKSTQAHHAIPVNSYWTSDEPYNRSEAEKLASADTNNFKVNLLYKDHQLIHSYLTMCTDLNEVQRRYEAQAELRKLHSLRANPLRYSAEVSEVKGSERKSSLTIAMPRYITEEKILAKLAKYEAALDLAKKAADEKAMHKYRTIIAQWKSKHQQYLENPEKYTNKKNLAKDTQNNVCHQNAKKRQELRQLITDLHNNYIKICETFPSQYRARKDPEVEKARLLWKQAIENYNKIFKN